MSVSDGYGITLNFTNFCGCRNCLSHTIILELLPANRSMLNLIDLFCILGSLIFFYIIEKKMFFLIVHALIRLCSPRGNFVDHVFLNAYHLTTFLQHVGSLAVGAFGFYSVLNTFPFLF